MSVDSNFSAVPAVSRAVARCLIVSILVVRAYRRRILVYIAHRVLLGRLGMLCKHVLDLVYGPRVGAINSAKSI